MHEGSDESDPPSTGRQPSIILRFGDDVGEDEDEVGDDDDDDDDDDYEGLIRSHSCKMKFNVAAADGDVVAHGADTC